MVVSCHNEMAGKIRRWVGVAMQVSDSVNNLTSFVQDFFLLHISFYSGIMVAGKKPEINFTPDCIQKLWQFRMLLPGDAGHRMFQIAEYEQEIGVCCLNTGEYALKPALRTALQMPSRGIKCTLDTKVDICYHQNRDCTVQKKCRPFGEEPGYHKSLIVLVVGI